MCWNESGSVKYQYLTLSMAPCVLKEEKGIGFPLVEIGSGERLSRYPKTQVEKKQVSNVYDIIIIKALSTLPSPILILVLVLPSFVV